MDLLIMNLIDAVQYEPKNKTYAIRIQSGLGHFNFELQNSGLYTVVEYTFDDDWPGFFGKIGSNSITFNEEIAHRIIADFKCQGLEHDTLLVHCSRGINRSPAVGIALNDIFELGHDTEGLKKKYPEANWFIYNTLIKAAKK